MQKKGKIGKWKKNFFIFLKNYEYDLWIQDYIFSSYLSIYQSRTRYRRDWDSNPSKLKTLFPKWMGFLVIFDPPRAERVKRGEGRSGYINPEFPPRTPNMKLEPQICSLLKVIQNWKFFSKWMKNTSIFWRVFLNYFLYKKMKKKIMGIGWGLGYRKVIWAPVYPNHQSPHTFFLFKFFVFHFKCASL